MNSRLPRRAALFQIAGLGGITAIAKASESPGDGQPSGMLPLPDRADISFVAAGRGAVRRSLQDKLREHVSIADFGADVAAPDNRIAIERAIVAAMTSGRGLYVPPGTFSYSRIDFQGNDAVSPVRLIISGPGTLRSTFEGVSIIASKGRFYDLVIDGLRFESVAGSGTSLIDGDKFIRLTFTPGTQISEFDWVLRAQRYLQSVRMIGTTIRGGHGAVVKTPMAYDCRFTGNIIEFVTDGIVIDGPNDPAVHTCSIDGNIIEGVGGRAIVLATCLATTVCGNYLEGNATADILLNAGRAPHKGLKVQSNSIQMSPARISAEDYGIAWGASTSLPAKAGGNFCNGRLHDTAGATAIIDMSGDFSPIELYRGYKAETSAGRAPIGRAVYNDGLAQYIAWFSRYMALDPHSNELRFGGKHDSNIGGVDEPPVMTFGSNSPGNNPGQFERKKWARGSIVFNAGAASGRPVGWICIAAGSPGGWISFPDER